MDNTVVIVNSSNKFWGAEASLLVFVKSLSMNKYSLIVRADGHGFSKNLIDSGISHSIHDIELSPKKAQIFKSALLLIGALFRLRSRHLYGNNEDLSSLFAVVRFLTFFYVRTNIHIRNPPRRFDYLKKLMFFHSSIICNSIYTKNCLVKSIPFCNHSKIFLVPNAHGQINSLGLDTHLEEKIEVFRPFFLTVGMINERKSQMSALKSFKDYSSPARPNYIFIGKVVGDNDYLDEIARYISVNQLNDCVSILPFETNLASYYSNAIATIVPSVSETFGRVIIESGFYGTPVIVRDIAPFRELVRHGDNGLVWNGSNDHLIYLMDLLVNDHKYRKFLGDNLREEVVGKFSNERYCQSLSGIIWNKI